MPADPCPDCRGKGTVAAFVETETHGYYDPAIPCTRCAGVGTIDEPMLRWIETGKRLRLRRIDRGESLGEMSRRTGMSPSQISAMEQGRADPAPLAPLYGVTAP